MTTDNKVENKLFLGMEVRVVNEEWIVLKDMFNALGRVKANGGWTDEKNKLYIILSTNNLNRDDCICKLKIITKSNKKHSTKLQDMLCIKIDAFNKIKDNFLLSFSKGNPNLCFNRLELNSVNVIKDFFKYDKYINIETQTQVMNYRIDMTIGSMCCVEFDENDHKYNKVEDIKRMKEISLAMSFDNDGCFMDANDIKNVNIDTLLKTDNFDVYECYGLLWIRLRNIRDLSWIPIMYDHYAEYMDFLSEDFKCKYNDLPSNMYKYKYAI